ncbi:AAA family ATPase [Amycolatopsis sp. YIM 10]|uniref:LuxR C-terminal-related transcriptional regulator n=1 Tax=Amycolatopsis sp. YIM 10 TaxID=2653857 RepID=UPI0012900F8E|nr:LuxR family transcriptional regulator [Amycolatopsis sp. YIM 10]QFU90324.1 Putative HTH-type transcriptional regulator [Amycolatopsis sp. YIM 10]
MSTRGTGVLAQLPDPMGRAAELAYLSAAVRDPGGPPLVLVRGGAGTGKTSLLQALRREVGDDRTVLYAAAPAEAEPYGVLRELMVPLGGIDDVLRRSRADRFALLADVMCPLMLAVNRGGVVVLVDDVASADEESLRWLDFVLRRAAGRPLLVVATLRQCDAGRAVGLAAEHESVSLRLDPLPEADVRRVVVRALGAVPDGGFTAACARMSAGNPRLLRRLLDELAARGVRPDAAAVPRVVAAGERLLALVVRDYLADRPPHVGVVLRALAVLGAAGPADPAVLPVLCDLPDALIAESLETLRRDEIVRPDSTLVAHPEFGGAALAQVLDGEVVRLRRHAAAVLSDQGVPAARVAHLLMALPELPEQWMHRVLCQAAAAVRGEDPDAAVRYLSRVLDWAPDDAETVVRLAETVVGTDPAAAMAFLGRAIDRIPDVRVRARLAHLFGASALAARRAPEAFGVLDRMLAEFDAKRGGRADEGDHELRGRIQVALTTVGLSEESTTADVLARLPEPRLGGDSHGSRVQGGLTAYTTMLGGRDAAAVAAQARLALVQGLPSRYPPPIIAAATALSYAGEPQEALTALNRLLKTAGGPISRTALAARATVLEGLGELPDAAADAQSAMHGAAELEGMAAEAVVPSVRLASILVKMGQPDRAESLLVRTRWPHFGWMYPQAVLVSAEVLRLRGDHASALAILFDCGNRLAEAGVRNPVFVPWWLEAACLLAELDRHEEAAALAEYGERTAREWRTAESAGLALLAAGVATRGRRSLDKLAEAVERLSTAPAPLSQARAEFLFGRALLAHDDTKGARAHLRGAIALATQSGYLALGSAARDLLVSAGGRMHTMLDARRLGALSGSELRVAELAAAGESNRAIADRLFVSLRTVETHLSSVYRKLRIGLRDELPAALRARSEELGA